MTRSFARVNTLPAGEPACRPPPPCARSWVQVWRGTGGSREDTHARRAASPAERVHARTPPPRTHLARGLAHLPAGSRRTAPRGDDGGGGRTLVPARAGSRRGTRESLSGAPAPQLPEQTSCEAAQGRAGASVPECGRASPGAAGGRRVVVVGPPGVGRRAF